jgi:hypothetical protein
VRADGILIIKMVVYINIRAKTLMKNSLMIKRIWYGLIGSLTMIINCFNKGLNPMYITPHDQRTYEDA